MQEFVQKARAEQAAKREKEGIKEEKVKVEVKKEEEKIEKKEKVCYWDWTSDWCCLCDVASLN